MQEPERELIQTFQTVSRREILRSSDAASTEGDGSDAFSARSSSRYIVLETAQGEGTFTTQRHPTKKPSGSIGNTTLHSLPGLYLFAISIARSMLSACNVTLNLAAPLFTSIEIFIIIFCFRIGPLRRSVWVVVEEAHLPHGYFL